MMRSRLLALIAAIPFGSAMAQAPDSFDPDVYQEYLEQAQKLQVCISQMDPREFMAWQQRVEGMIAEVDALCTAGKAAEARTSAIGFGREIVDSAMMKQLQSCAGLINPQLMPSLAWAALDAAEESGQSVCP